MKKIFLIAALPFVIFSGLYAQTFQWAKHMGGANYVSTGSSITVDALGNVYTTGVFKGIVDFDPGPAIYNITANQYSSFVSKLDPSGVFVWAKAITNNDASHGSGIEVDVTGNVYVTGYFNNTLDFDPGPGIFNMTAPAGTIGGYILKLNSMGNFVWAKSFIGVTDCMPSSITIDNNGNVYSSGYYGGTVDFDPGVLVYNMVAVGAVDIFISKLDSNGNFIWAKSMGGTDSDLSTSIKVDLSGNVYTTGTFRSQQVDFDPGIAVYILSNFGLNRDIFVSKLNSNGDFVWAKSIGYTNEVNSNGLALDKANNILITGYYDGTLDFDPDTIGIYNMTAYGLSNIYVLKLDVNGNFVWAKSMGGTDNSESFAIDVDSSGSVYTAGATNSGDFDPGPGIYNLFCGNADIFVSKLDKNGNFAWVRTFICISDFDKAFSIKTDNTGSVYTTGSFYNSTDFDPGLGVFTINPFAADIFVHKMNTCTNTTLQIIDTACFSYTLNGQTYDSSGNYTQLLTNIQGCDSAITLNLTINQVNDSIALGVNTLYCYAVGAIYQWITCSPFAIVANETNSTFTPSNSGNYACIVTENGCTDTSDCQYIFIVGVHDYADLIKFSIFPNPSPGIFALESSVPLNNAEINITDYLGQIIFQASNFKGKQIDLNISAYPTGVYFVKLKDGSIIRNLKVVKQ